MRQFSLFSLTLILIVLIIHQRSIEGGHGCICGLIGHEACELKCTGGDGSFCRCNYNTNTHQCDLIDCPDNKHEGGRGIWAKYDLSPLDIHSLCKVVDPSTVARKPKDCVYMKWQFYPGADSKSDRPLGFYVQSKCPPEPKGHRRGKRELGELERHNQMDTPEESLPLIDLM